MGVVKIDKGCGQDRKTMGVVKIDRGCGQKIGVWGYTRVVVRFYYLIVYVHVFSCTMIS